MENVLAWLPLVAVLIAGTNIIAEVLKNVFPSVPAQVVVAVIAVVLTVLVVVFYGTWQGVNLLWYHYVGGIVGGLLVAYGAMFGYDNLYEQIMKAFRKDGE